VLDRAAREPADACQTGPHAQPQALRNDNPITLAEIRIREFFDMAGMLDIAPSLSSGCGVCSV
jgi:hypothetical protein